MKIINYILQIFNFKLLKYKDKTIKDYQLLSYDLMSDNTISSRGVGTVKESKFKYKIIVNK